MRLSRDLAKMTYPLVSGLLAGFSVLVALVGSVYVGNGLVSTLIVAAATVASAAFVGAMYSAIAWLELTGKEGVTHDSALSVVMWHTATFHLGLASFLVVLAATGFLVGVAIGAFSSIGAALIFVLVARIALWAKDADA